MRDVIRRLVRRRGALWSAFLAVHLWNAVMGVAIVGDRAFGDLELYRHWAGLGLHQGIWPTLQFPSVYPVGSVVPMVVASLGGVGSRAGYAIAWSLMVTALDAAALAVLLRRPRGMAGGRWWTAFLLLLGPVGLGRIDAVVVPLTLIALLWALDRPVVASFLLTAGAWIKVAPGALLWPLFAAVRRPWRDVVLPAAALTGLVVLTVRFLGRSDFLATFLTDQSGRGLQLEAVGAVPWLLAALVTRSVLRVDNLVLNDWELHGVGTRAAGQVLGVLFVLAVVAAAGLVWWRRELLGARLRSDRTAGAELVVRGALLMTLTMIVFDKVGSPQYMTWLAAPVAAAVGLGLPGWRRTARWALVVAGVTQAVFPWLYPAITRGDAVGAAVLAARNVLLVVLLVWTARTLVLGGRERADAGIERVAQQEALDRVRAVTAG
ncbi:MAG: DUF2029 domain-containing protein [Actinomycetales bacterium]|nr:DUF2029 domain-containing protein [Actinomycetales bacterium]